MKHDLVTHETGHMEHVAVPTWQELSPLVEEFMALRDYAESSAYQVRHVIRRFIEWASKTNASNPLQFRQYMMVERGTARSTIATQFSILRIFWEYLMHKGVVTHNPFRMVTVRHSEITERKALSDDEVERLITTLATADTRTRAIVNLMIRTGLRIQAVRLADVEDIDTSTNPHRMWVWQKGHHAKDLFVLLYPGAMRALAEWLDYRPVSDDPALFISMNCPNKRLSYHAYYKSIQRVFTAAGLSGYSPHTLRHTAITLARQHGATLDSVREMAGHADPKTTLRYDHSIQRWKNPPEEVLDNLLEGGSDGGE